LFILLLAGSLNIQSHWQSRTTLDHLLGEPVEIPSEPSLESPLSEMDRLNQEMDTLFHDFPMASEPLHLAQSFSLQTPSPDITESDKAYVIKVPLSQPEDAKNINVTLDPHFIRLQGQIPLKSPDGKTTLGSSSFLKAFPTADEINPSGVNRSIEGKLLVITVPKKPGGHAPKAVVPNQNRPLQPNTPPAGQPQPIQKKLQQSPQSFI
jgi:HSP20 family molecular chaperone IbpA